MREILGVRRKRKETNNGGNARQIIAAQTADTALT
jgi:hypothetical protein